MQTKKFLDIENTTILKGLAILMIVMHNLCTRMPFTASENEFTYHTTNNAELLQQLSLPDIYLPLTLLSYFGHYFVALFIFLSGYGLVRKYESPDNEHRISLIKFTKTHYLKLATMLIPVMTAYFIAMSIIEPNYLSSNILEYGLMVLLIDNLYMPGNHILGPWWFFSMIMQLYVVYYLFAYKRPLRPIIILTIICVLIQVLTIPGIDHNYRLIFIRNNFPGYILPFVIGIFFARKGYLPSGKMAALAFLLFLLSCFNAYSWILSFALFPIILLPIATKIQESALMRKAFKWLGIMSAYIFVIHPVIREIVFHLPSWEKAPYTTVITYTFISIMAAIPIRYVSTHIRQYLSRKRII